MQRIFTLLITLFSFYNCASQRNLIQISSEEIPVLNSTKVEHSGQNEIKIFSTQEEFDEFQLNLPQTHQRSAPIVSLDFTTKKAVAIYMDQIGSYQIENLEIKNNKGTLNLKSIEGYQNPSSANLIILEIPKEITQLTLKK